VPHFAAVSVRELPAEIVERGHHDIACWVNGDCGAPKGIYARSPVLSNNSIETCRPTLDLF
jgi:hypothetical protein